MLRYINKLIPPEIPCLFPFEKSLSPQIQGCQPVYGDFLLAQPLQALPGVPVLSFCCVVFLYISISIFKMSSASELPDTPPHSSPGKSEERGEDSLTVVDNRTGHSHNIPISQNSIRATEFQRFKSPRNAENPAEQNHAGIRVFDPGFQNTACMESEITYVDGDAGEISYRGVPLADLFYSGRPFEHVAFLLIFGHLPSDSEAKAFNTSIATSEMPPQAIFDTINSLPYVVKPNYIHLFRCLS